MTKSPRALEALPLYIGGGWVRTAERQIVSLPYDGTPVGACYQADAALVAHAIKIICWRV